MALCVSLALFAAAPAAAQTGNDLFQQALVKERADGDVRGAIRIYERIVREFARDRALAARTLVQLGGCQERLGDQEARRAYRRVVQEYPDQREMVEEARARLAVLGAGATAATARAAGDGVTMREIRFEGLENTPFAVASPDGRKMAYIYYRPAQQPQRYSLRVRTLASDEEIVLVDSLGGPTAPFAWSRDGSHMAFSGPSRDLRTVAFGGGAPRVVWSSPAGTTVIPLDWAPDGDRILVAVRNMARWSHELVIVSLSGAAPRSVRSGSLYELLDWGRFSPDGAYIAGMKTGDVYVWSVDGREEIRVTTDPAEDAGPFWSPDGRFLVFFSDRFEARDLWAVPVRGGAPSGPPVRVKTGLGRRIMPTGMTAAGGITLQTYGEGAPDELYALDVDPAAGAVAGAFRPVARRPQARLSPDGRRFAYASRKGEVRWPTIYVGSGASQQDIELPMRDHYPMNVEWGRDGESLIFPGFRRQDGRVGIFRLSLSDQTIEPLHLGDPPGPGFLGSYLNLVWMPAAGRYFVQRILGQKRFGFYVLEADGSGLRRTADSVPTIAWAWPSPDGRHVAYRDERSLRLIRLDDQVTRTLGEWQDTTWFDVAPGWSGDGRQVAWTDRVALRALDTHDGTARVLVEAPRGSQIVAAPAWAPGGTHVAYVVRDTTTGASSRPDEVWLVPSTGGSPRRLALAPEAHPRLHLETWLQSGALAAAGSQRSPSAGVAYRHWLLEGFLPEVAGVRRR
jgi:Tol biopolymer transport system component